MTNEHTNEQEQGLRPEVPQLRRSWLKKAFDTLTSLNADFPLSGSGNDNDFIIWQSKDRKPKTE